MPPPSTAAVGDLPIPSLVLDGDVTLRCDDIRLAAPNTVDVPALAVLGGTLVILHAPNISLTGVDTMTLGIIISFLSMTRQLSQTIGQASMQVSMVAMGLAGAGRVFELIDQKAEEDHGYVHLVNAKKDADGNIIECEKPTGMWAWKHPHSADGTVSYRELTGDVRLEHVNFGYTPDKTVLHDVTLYAKPGQKIAFVGATGAGKTTITNLIKPL